MKRGNEPVASNYEEMELHPMKANDLVIIPNAEESAKSPPQLGTIKLGAFEEEVSGINLSKLFSVYGPQSTQEKKKRKETQVEVEESEDDEDSEDEDEEPLIIQLMESMFTRKKTVLESEQMISEISVDEIRKEFRRLALKEKCKLSDLERQKLFEQRMKECEKLNELI